MEGDYGRDGVNFRPDAANPILVQSARYPASGLYEGYSTPSALVAGGTFHLAYDVAQNIGGEFRQVAIALAASTDGRTFSEVAPDIPRAGRLDHLGNSCTHAGRRGRGVRVVVCGE